jgi:hypothetical protein
LISHSLTIVANEMQRHFIDAYGVSTSPAVVAPGNIAEGIATTNGSGGVAREMLVLSVVNLREEKALKNLPHIVRNDATLRVTYENPPLFLNLTTLLTATHAGYNNALLVLSRALRFFQSNSVFTHDTVAPSSLTQNAPTNAQDQLSEFRLIFDLYSPSFEEVNHMWGTLGGKQYPFALFNMRLVDLKFRAVQAEGGLITEVVRDFVHQSGVS